MNPAASSSRRKPLVIIDGNNWTNRFFHGIKQPLTARDGTPTNAVHGWMSNVWRVWEEFDPEAVVAVFDKGRCAFRLGLLPTYKGTRVKGSGESSIVAQMGYIQELLPCIGVSVVASPNVEADDIIGTIAARAHAAGQSVFIMTNDKDMFQCATYLDNGHPDEGFPQVSICRFTGDPSEPWHVFSREEAESVIGVSADKIPAYLALVGDASDNIPGVPGVGAKTAVAWLSHHDWEEIIECPVTLQPERLRLALYNNLAQARVAYEVATLQQITDKVILAGTSPGKINIEIALKFMDRLSLKSAADKMLGRQKLGLTPFDR